MSRIKVVYKWNKETIQSLLDTNDAAVYRGLLAIYARQTTEEQHSENTYYQNGMGFSGIDGNIMSSFAKQLIRYKTLSPKQMVIARRRMKRYWKQLVLVATENGKNPVVSN